MMQLRRKFSRTLEPTCFSGAPVVPVAAKCEGVDASIGIDELVQVNDFSMYIPIALFLILIF